jgi:hypothetical protein
MGAIALYLFIRIFGGIFAGGQCTGLCTGMTFLVILMLAADFWVSSLTVFFFFHLFICFVDYKKRLGEVFCGFALVESNSGGWIWEMDLWIEWRWHTSFGSDRFISNHSFREKEIPHIWNMDILGNPFGSNRVLGGICYSQHYHHQSLTNKLFYHHGGRNFERGQSDGFHQMCSWCPGGGPAASPELRRLPSRVAGHEWRCRRLGRGERMSEVRWWLVRRTKRFLEILQSSFSVCSVTPSCAISSHSLFRSTIDFFE